MSLSKRFAKLVLFFSALFVASVVGITFMFSSLVRSDYESERLERGRVRLQAAYEYLQKNLSSRVDDWANWDEAYRFVQKPNHDFIKKNLTPNALKLSGTDIIVFADDNKKTLGSVVNKSLNRKQVLSRIEDVLKMDNAESSDFVTINNKVYLYSLKKVSDSLTQKSPHGFILMAYELDDRHLEFLRDLAGLKIQISQMAQANTVQDLTITAQQEFFDKSRREHFYLNFSIERRLKEYFKRAQILQICLMAFMLPLFFLITFLFLKKNYVNPLAILRKQMMELMSSNEKVFIEVDRKDEIGELLHGLNQIKKNKIEEFDEFENQRSKMLQKNRLEAIGEMAAGFAHEINNPLAIIKGKLNLLEKKLVSVPDTEHLMSYIQGCYHTVDRISKIISSLKNFSRYNEDNGCQEYHIADLLDSVRVMTNDLVKSKSVSLRVNCADVDKIYCNSIQIQQVLINLICNSVSAIEEHHSRWIQIECFSREDYFQILVSDSGSGISSEVAEKMFDPFFTTKNVGEGTGIGLSLSASIVHSHGGRIYLSKESANTCFVVEIPHNKAFQVAS